MWRKTLITLLILLSTPLVFAGVEATLFNHYFYPGDDLNFHIEITEDFTGTADLKFCLANFDFTTLNYNYRCDIFLERFDITFDQTYSADYSLSLNGIQPLIYRLFVQLHFDDKYHKDSDKDNFIYLTKDDEPVTYIYNPAGVSIRADNIPNEVEQGGELETSFNVTIFENCSRFYAYSFINNGTQCATGRLNENIVELELPYSSTTHLTLKNEIGYNATIGGYYYTIRISGCGKNHDLKQPIRVIEKQNPDYNITIKEYEIILKNYDSTNISYALIIINQNSTQVINGTIQAHAQERVFLNNTDQFLTIRVNNAEVFNKLLLNNTREVITNYTIIYSNITGNITLPVEGEEKPFYILSILTSVGALLIMYTRLR
jgi:hypothetical protein